MIATTLEQSRKLVELGVNPETADMSWAGYSFGRLYLRAMPIKGYPEELSPAWSLSALLKMIPNVSLYIKSNHLWGCAATWGTPDEFGDCPHCLKEDYDSPIEAAYYVVVWLKGNNYI